MEGNKRVIAKLQVRLSEELAAVHQYKAHAAQYDNWGYKRLAELANNKAAEELGHAEELMERLTFFNVVPDVVTQASIVVKSTVPEMIKADYDAEVLAIKVYNEDVALALENGDWVSAKQYFGEHAEDESRHANDWESELKMIQDMGLQNYLAEQMRA